MTFSHASVLCVVAMLAMAAAAAPVPMHDGAVLGAHRAATLGWVREGRTRPHTVLDFMFAMKNRNVDMLEATLMAVSNPDSQKYRQHLTFDDVRRMTAPTEEALGRVLAFATAHGATSVKVLPSGDFVHVHMTARNAARAFGVPQGFHRFLHATTGEVLHRTLEHYSLPVEVAAVVHFVGGVSRLPRVSDAARRVHQSAAAAADAAAALASSNAPQVFAISGGADSQTAFYMPKCADGSPVPATGSSCDVLDLQFLWQPFNSAAPSVTATFAPSGCSTCAELKGKPQILGSDPYTTCSTIDKTLPSPARYCYQTLKASKEQPLPVGYVSNVTIVTNFNDGTAAASSQDVVVQPFITPDYMKALNAIKTPQPVCKTSTQAVVEFLGQYYAPADLTMYQNTYDIKSAMPITVNGPNDVSNPGLEASLDIQVITALATSSATSFWSTSGLRNNSAPPSDSNQEPFLRWITRLMSLSDGDAPVVNSVSYDDDEYALPHGFTSALNVQFMKAGARGMTLLFAAGDDGVGGEGVRSNGTSACPVFRPAFPASSPYVTAVGGTQLLAKGSGGALTQVVSDTVTNAMITSGGGFSNRFATPEYQASAVSGYLNKYAPSLPPSNYFNATGRGYPDISGIATNYHIVISESFVQVGGTSASTPLIAAMVSMLNSELMCEGDGKPLGFINPLIYQLYSQPGATPTCAGCYDDVVFGNNTCSAVPTNCCAYGFEASRGWDSTTGVGAPVFDTIRKYVIGATKSD